jgi:hypothetical protein
MRIRIRNPELKTYVTMSDSWRSLWMVCLLAWMPTTQLSVKAAQESPTKRMERSTFATIIGLNTLSSK